MDTGEYGTCSRCCQNPCITETLRKGNKMIPKMETRQVEASLDRLTSSLSTLLNTQNANKYDIIIPLYEISSCLEQIAKMLAKLEADARAKIESVPAIKTDKSIYATNNVCTYTSPCCGHRGLKRDFLLCYDNDPQTCKCHEGKP
jgi:hypothetical protein